MYFFPYSEPVCCSMSSSSCCFLTCLQISQEAGQVVWYSHLFKNFPQFVVIHTVKGLYKLDLEKAEEPEIRLPTSVGSSKKQESSRKNIYFCFIDYAKAFFFFFAKAFDCVDHNKQWKIRKEMGIPDHLTWLLRNL